MLFAEAKESTATTVSETTSSSSHTNPTTHSEITTFHRGSFTFTAKSVSSNIFEDGILEALPQNKKIAFEFELPMILVI
jgi:hypothetical protein